MPGAAGAPHCAYKDSEELDGPRDLPMCRPGLNMRLGHIHTRAGPLQHSCNTRTTCLSTHCVISSSRHCPNTAFKQARPLQRKADTACGTDQVSRSCLMQHIAQENTQLKKEPEDESSRLLSTPPSVKPACNQATAQNNQSTTTACRYKSCLPKALAHCRHKL